MALDVGTLVAYLQVEEKGMDKGLAEGEGKLKSFGRKAVSIAKVASLAIGAGLVAAIPGLVSAAGDLAESQSKVAVIFGDSAKAITDYAEVAAAKIGQSKQNVLDAASTFATFGKAAGLTGAPLAKFSTDLVGLSSDIGSFFNVDPAAAAEAVGAALRGESEPIRAFGVMLDEATIKAKAIEMGLLKSKVSIDEVAKANLNARIAQQSYNEETKKTGPNSLESQKKAIALKEAQEKLAEATQGTVGDLTKQQKILATSAAIYDQTKDAQGDFARTSDGLANQQRALGAEFDNVKAELGTELLPYAKDFVEVLRNMIKWGKENKDWLVPTVAILGGVAAAIWLVTIAQTALTAVLAASGIPLIIIAVAALIALIVWLATKTQFFQTIWGAVWGFMKGVGAWFAGPFVDFFVGAFNWLTKKGDEVRAFVWDMFVTIASAPGKLAMKLYEGAKKMLGGLVDAFKWAINFVIDLWNKLDLVISIPDWVPGIGGKKADLFPDLPRLYGGGLVPGSHRGTPVIMGDGNRAEIASPEPLMRRIVRDEVRAAGGNTRGWHGYLTLNGTGMLRDLRATVRIGGGDPKVVLAGSGF